MRRRTVRDVMTRSVVSAYPDAQFNELVHVMAADLMTTPAVSVRPETTIVQAAQLLVGPVRLESPRPHLQDPIRSNPRRDATPEQQPKASGDSRSARCRALRYASGDDHSA